MLSYVREYVTGMVRRVTAAEIEVFHIDRALYDILLLCSVQQVLPTPGQAL